MVSGPLFIPAFFIIIITIFIVCPGDTNTPKLDYYVSLSLCMQNAVYAHANENKCHDSWQALSQTFSSKSQAILLVVTPTTDHSLVLFHFLGFHLFFKPRQLNPLLPLVPFTFHQFNPLLPRRLPLAFQNPPHGFRTDFEFFSENGGGESVRVETVEVT